jgi:hypothetical protein
VLGQDWTSADAIAEALVAEHGAPGEGSGALVLTEQALQTLSEHALVDLDDA